MKLVQLSTIAIALLLSACAHIQKPEGKTALPGTNTVINGIYLDNGMPAVKHNKVILYNNQKLLFAGPDEFTIEFKEGSFFKNSNNKNPNVYNSRNGVAILEVSEEKTSRLKDSAAFKYSVFVNGKELDPLAIWKREH